jgi:hypothetical protein
MKIEDIISLEPEKAIRYLKKRKMTAPDTQTNFNDWNVDKHEIMTDKEKYPDRKTLVKDKEDIYDEASGKTFHKEPVYETEPANRITIPLEQDIVNIQTAFTVGTDPKMNCEPANDEEKNLLSAVNAVLTKNKVKYQNKKVVRAWLSEQEVAEYWYVVDDDSFWAKFWAKIKKAFGGTTKPNKKLRSVLWSPFRGDTLYPFYDEYNDLLALSREYEREDLEGKKITCFQTITKDMVYQWENTDGWKLIPEKTFKHGFEKMPVLYAYLAKPYCHKIKTIRVRIEKLLSSYADCIDYHFFPILKLFGDVDGVLGKKKDRVVKLEGENADAEYLIWQQAPETIKLELETMFNNAYAMTNTPRISFETMKGFGETPSGTAFRFVFMGAHMQVENHTEDIGDFLQRRVNFLVSALGSINPYEFNKASKTIDIDVEVVPYMVDSLDERVGTAIKAVDGKVWSRREGIIFAGNAERVDEILKEIEEENKMSEENSKNEGKSVA